MRPTIHQLHVQFIEQCRYASRLRPSTINSYEAAYRLLALLSPGMNIDGLTPERLVEFFRKLEDRVRVVGKGSVRRGVRSSTIMTYRMKLSAFFTWLVAQGHIKVNPLSHVAAPSVEYEDRKYLGRRDVERIFIALTMGIGWKSPLVKKRNVAIFSILLNCGLRAGELLGLRLLDVDWDRAELTVRSETSKSRRRRRLPLNSPVLDALHDYMQERHQGGVTDPALWVSGEHDRPLTRDGLKHLVERVKAASGVRFHIHQLRHTFAVNLLCSGSDVTKLKQLLGHQDVRMTCSYLRCLPVSALRPDVERLNIDTLV